MMLTLHDGTQMPALGLGTWKSEPEEVYRAVRAAIEVGYRHIDCASIYMNEEEVGRALSDAFKAGDASREDVWVTSKLWNDAHAPHDVQPALEDSLERLQLEHLDLYLIHWPVALRPGVSLPRGPGDFIALSELPLATTWEAMLKLSTAGLARQVGVSNFSAPKIAQIQGATGVAPAVNQIELHPYLQQSALVNACHEMGVGVTAYSPLGSPDSAQLFGRTDDTPLLEHPTIRDVAAEHGGSPGQVLIAWALARGTSVVPKSVNPTRIAENLKAQELSLTPTNMEAISKLDAHRRMVEGTFWYQGDTYSPETLWDE